MKTSKLVMIATVVAITMLSFSFINVSKAANVNSSKAIIYLTFEEAMWNPGLVAVMYENLDDRFLEVKQHYNYTAKVDYMRYHFHITGTHSQWTEFFNISWLSTKIENHID